MESTTFRIGGDLGVQRLGFGAMRLPTEPASEREASLAVARRAVELGVWRPVAAGASGARAEIASVAAESGATATQVALAWLLGHSPVILPIPGTARIDHLEENLAAADLHLAPAQRERLDRLSVQA